MQEKHIPARLGFVGALPGSILFSQKMVLLLQITQEHEKKEKETSTAHWQVPEEALCRNSERGWDIWALLTRRKCSARETPRLETLETPRKTLHAIRP